MVVDGRVFAGVVITGLETSEPFLVSPDDEPEPSPLLYIGVEVVRGLV